MRQIQNFHMDTKGWSDFAYSFAVDEDGTIFEGRGPHVAGGHTRADNTTSHAIVFMGNFQNRPLPRSAVESAADLLRHGKQQGWWLHAAFCGSHRDAQAQGFSPYNGTVCAGDGVQAELSTINALASASPEPPTQEEDIIVPVIDIYKQVRDTYAEAGAAPEGKFVAEWVAHVTFAVEAAKPESRAKVYKRKLNDLRTALGLATIRGG